jgi:hypothetical protein
MGKRKGMSDERIDWDKVEKDTRREERENRKEKEYKGLFG